MGESQWGYGAERYNEKGTATNDRELSTGLVMKPHAARAGKCSRNCCRACAEFRGSSSPRSGEGLYTF